MYLFKSRHITHFHEMQIQFEKKKIKQEKDVFTLQKIKKYCSFPESTCSTVL